MRTTVEKYGLNIRRNGEYDQLVSAGTYEVRKEKRTNVRGEGIIATSPDGKRLEARNEEAIRKQIEADAVRYGKRFAMKDKAVLVVWRVSA